MGLKSSWLKSLGLKSPRRLKDISTPDFSTTDFSTPDFSTPDFSTMNFSTPRFKNSWLKSLGWKVHGWNVWGWKFQGWILGLKSPGLRCPSTVQTAKSSSNFRFCFIKRAHCRTFLGLWFEIQAMKLITITSIFLSVLSVNSSPPTKSPSKGMSRIYGTELVFVKKVVSSFVKCWSIHFLNRGWPFKGRSWKIVKPEDSWNWLSHMFHQLLTFRILI